MYLPFSVSSTLVIIAFLLVLFLWVNYFLFFPALLPPPSPPLVLSPLKACGGLSAGMRERGEWGRQALSWLSWELLAPCVLGPALPPLSINLQWQLHCLPNPPKILGDDWPAPFCSINLWPPALRHQTEAKGLGLAGLSTRLDTCLRSETELLSHINNLCKKTYLDWTWSHCSQSCGSFTCVYFKFSGFTFILRGSGI